MYDEVLITFFRLSLITTLKRFCQQGDLDKTVFFVPIFFARPFSTALTAFS